MCAAVLLGGQKPSPDRESLVASGNGRHPPAAPLLAAAFNALLDSVAIVDAAGLIVSVNDAWRGHADDNGIRLSRYGIGSNYLSVLDNASQDVAGTAEIARGIREVLAGSIDSCRAEYGCEAPNRCYFSIQATGFDFGGVRHAVIAHEDITLLRMSAGELRLAKEAAEAGRRDEELRRRAAESRLRITETVADLRAVASSSVGLEGALQGMVERICESLGCQGAAIYSAEERWDRLVPVAACGIAQHARRRGKVEIAPAILARAIASQHGAAVDDVRNNDTQARQAAYQGLLVAPIQCQDRLYGYLVVFCAEPKVFVQEDVELGHLFAREVSLALDHAELRKRAAKTAVDNERTRLARDLHDAVTQTLFSSSVVAEALPRVWERDPIEGRRALEDLRSWTRGALAEMRALLMELHPAALVEKPLADLIRQLGDAASTRLLIPVVCEITAEVEPPPAVKLALYRIAQEALNNIVKHSQASHVVLCYVARRQGVELAIVDNGRGFDAHNPGPGQMGLGIMRERARDVRAKLAVRSAPGLGTEVCVDWRPRGRKI